MSRQADERNFSMFLPPLDRILGPEAQKMHFFGFWGSIHVFLHCKMAKKSILRGGALFFRLLGGWSPFMWSGLPPGRPLDPTDGYWEGPFGVQLGLWDPNWGPIGPLGPQLGANWAIWDPN